MVRTPQNEKIKLIDSRQLRASPSIKTLRTDVIRGAELEIA